MFLPGLSRSKSVAAVLVAGSLVLNGCATQGLSDAPTFDVVYYKTCYEPINYLRESEQKLQEAVVMGAIGGALLGALAGGLLGGDGSSAAIGAATGAMAGGLGAYAMQKQQQIQDDKLRFASYADDIRKDAGEMNRALAAAEKAQGCYRNEIATLMAGKRAGTMPLQEGRGRLNEIVSGLREVKALIEGAGKRFDDNIGTYQSAYETELVQKGVDKEEVQRAVEWSQPAAYEPPAPTETYSARNRAKKAAPAAQPPRPSGPKPNVEDHYVAASRELHMVSQTNDRRRQVLLDADRMMADACSQGGEFGGGACAAKSGG
ncbi:MAG: type VI secretion-associated lipoprotein TagQ [Alphaproteobacteria bacterium]|nr:type VI secretion-associated lipoprotein TagQ [Alphaproteobacteria bacterium]